MGQAARAAQQLQGLRQAGDQLLRGRLQLQRVGSCGTSGDGGGGGGRERVGVGGGSAEGAGRGGVGGREVGSAFTHRDSSNSVVTVTAVTV